LLKQIKKSYQVNKISVYLFGVNDKTINPEYEVFSGSENLIDGVPIGPCQWVVKYLKDYTLHMFRALLIQGEKLTILHTLNNANVLEIVKMCYDRLANIDLEATQTIWSGLIHINKHNSAFENTIKFFREPEILESVKTSGELVAIVHQQMVSERVFTSSQILKMKVQITDDDHKSRSELVDCSVCEATELIIMTHAEMRRIYGTGVTIVWFKTDTNTSDDLTVRYSIKSWNPSISAEKIAQCFGGGGSNVAAGCQTVLNRYDMLTFPLPRIWSDQNEIIENMIKDPIFASGRMCDPSCKLGKKWMHWIA